MNTRCCMRSLFLLLLVLSVLFSNLCCVEVQAQEIDDDYIPTQETSTFFGNEVSLMDSISFFTEVEGYQLNKFYKSDTMSDWMNFTSDSIVTESGVAYDFMFEIQLPKTISKNTMFNTRIKFDYTGVKRFSGNAMANLVRGQWENYFSENLTYTTHTNVKQLHVRSENEITAQNDVDRICVYIYDVVAVGGSMRLNPFSVDVTETSTNGMLSGIIEWIKSIKEGITELPSKIASSIKGFFDNVVNAVVNLGTTILDGIKGLFVPDQEDITRMQQQWNSLLEDRFGALYQAIDIIHDYAASFTASEKSTIEFPEVSIPLGNDNFVFGGWTVKVVPDGFGVIIDALKLMISIISTFAFVNAMKNRLEKLVGGADNI